jgi:glycosyltransferase involved in cell wall biosynthesis
MIDRSQILFLGIGKSSVFWYRCALPAIHLGADWCGVRGDPPNVVVMTGLVRGETSLPNYADYKVVVLQQVYGRKWLLKIRQLQANGIKVIYEIDDYVHGVDKQAGHDYAKYFTKDRLREYEMCMRVCDGIITSTDYIARRYAKYNRNIYICRNGLDLARYQLTRPERPTTNIGWAGATGHIQALVPWINATIPVLRSHPDTAWVSIGGEQGVAEMVGKAIGRERHAIGIPFTTLECYPAAMCMIDIMLAPAGKTGWYRGKSDLRWLEASALGIPVIADPIVYPEIEHGVTGFHAETPQQVTEILRELIADEELRTRVGKQARDYVELHRSSEDAAMQWSEVLSAVAGEHESIHQLRRS